MKYSTFFIVLFFFFNLFQTQDLFIIAQNSAVSITDRGTYFEIILDYTTGTSHYEMGKQIGQKILQIFPNLEQLADGSLTDLTVRESYNTILNRMYDMKPQVQQEYMDEMDGIALQLCSSNENIRNDGKLSRDEVYMLFLSSDLCEISHCSSISIFGPRSATGSSITARLNDGSGNPDLYHAMTQAVITVKNSTRSICMIGGLSIGAATGFNNNGIFAALHSSSVNLEFTTKNKRSYLMDVRYALENFSTSDEIAQFFTSNSKNYVRNNLIQLTDKNSTRILENNFSGNGTNVRCALRSDISALNPGITWGFPHAIATANSFLLEGNTDNHTDNLSCTGRWNTIKNQLQVFGDKVDLDELRQLASFDNGDGPDLQETGDIYNIGTNQIVLFQPDNLYLEVAFRPRTDILPEDPVFEVIPVNFNEKPLNTGEQNGVITSYSLEQNYPNPFNPTTTLSFVIGNSSFVALKIYDILGREVATLVNEKKEPGIYTVKWDAANLASGVYICLMHAKAESVGKEFRSMKKMLLLK